MVEIARLAGNEIAPRGQEPALVIRVGGDRAHGVHDRIERGKSSASEFVQKHAGVRRMRQAGVFLPLSKIGVRRARRPLRHIHAPRAFVHQAPALRGPAVGVVPARVAEDGGAAGQHLLRKELPVIRAVLLGMRVEGKPGIDGLRYCAHDELLHRAFGRLDAKLMTTRRQQPHGLGRRAGALAGKQRRHPIVEKDLRILSRVKRKEHPPSARIHEGELSGRQPA